jgi:RNA polymerase sigma factor (sigma-70 family)
MTAFTVGKPLDRGEAFDRLLGELRPKLHRYCARMTGSVLDGEDVVHEAIVKAMEALSQRGSIAHPEAWLFRIAHNAALDFLRHRARQDAAHADEDLDMIIDPAAVADHRQVIAASLRTFMRLPVAQRGSVILMDVLGYSLEEIGSVMDVSIATVKAALHRGRARLRELAREPDDVPLPVLGEPERSLLAAYVERDVVHEAIVKAMEALSHRGSIAHPEAWLFRIAHNAALDFLRHRARQDAAHADEDLDMIIDPAAVADHRQVIAASLRTFMRFNARDFDAIRDMLADEVRLDLVAKLQKKGRTEVATYFDNYARLEDWHFVPGLVDGHPAALVHNPSDPTGKAGYFILLQWEGDRVANIRDFRFARYATEDAELLMLD